MAKLNDKQARLLASVRETRAQVDESLAKLEDDYIYADFRAKSPVRDAVQAALDAGVPYKRIAEEGMGFTYPAKLRAFLQAPDAVVRRLMDANPVVQAVETFEDTVEQVKSVTRDGGTGEITVVYKGLTYTVPSFGPAGEFWSSAVAEVPQAVYDLIQAEFPQWELLEEEEED